MAVHLNEKHDGFHWNFMNISFAAMLGVAAATGIWLLAGLLMALFLL